ncbi:hypothetical protein [Adlercreutzia muris]|uniref:hypothetical protein n=1 Tax=Adlercreutzia muris TaxID=1796610 RepID=UPI0013667384|nr:hypothetical protein [Adlercreutzia muris]NCA32129.1 hypothetical protein [Adlercreutzia muris]
MAGEDLGKKANPEEAKGADGGADDKGGDAGGDKGGKDESGDDHDGDVTDKHGQPGVNRDKYKRDVEGRDKRIAELEAKLAEAAETKEGREKLEKSIADLKAEMADKDTSHALEIAGCVDVKAAKSRLGDFDGDVAKLKAECPYLFQAEKKKGSTGLDPKGPSTGLDDRIDAAMGVK